MKKSYIAPELYFEDFSLSHSVAAGCSQNAIDNIKFAYDLEGAFLKSNPSNYMGLICSYTEISVEDYFGSNEKAFLS